ncbi:looped-hinge helix DNA binding domain, AbrB family [Desulfosporosinus orientis DSM 765]|uniref:Looped-hinge helix DNA binding domain, AbrB family n=1 Tax=Desulfosporosinus orientis (strain ATCC 19365 / DSM 765 / NCIMB 8382 / VKM B-1628 / Singapore I) TaxID=768706 RepID=G7WBR0_DESOD|nr:type II toxin-antitoxin system RelE/ParE family toxin [Desulfosporosinus orientis]AET68818.1 looped-hinge helix DNA binding domain, AbrB family [Desulfosporosinus orientis DSM 765]
METYRVKVGAKGEIVLPAELRKLFGLVAEDTLDLCVDSEGKVFVRSAERSAGPLSDFFEDLIVNELLAKGCSGDCLKNKLLEQKLKLSTVLDRLSEEAHRAHKNGQSIKCWDAQALTSLGIRKIPNGDFNVMITTRGIHDLVVLRKEEIKEIPAVFESLEQDPFAFKRLKGPYYETYRVSFRSGNKEYRVIYTVFAEEKLIVVLTVGARKAIYDRLNGIA